MSKIYDCFPFFNELDILEIRFEMLYPYVDYFVISECDYTFSGLKKPFYFEENKKRFEKYSDKIVHLKHINTKEFSNLQNIYQGRKGLQYQKILDRLSRLMNSPATNYGQPHWCRDYLHKELTMLGLVECDHNDIILFSDCDEIPNPDTLKEILEKIKSGSSSRIVMKQKNMTYWLNNENISEDWFGQYICKYSDILESSLMYTRENRIGFETFVNGGWHLSFMGGYYKIVEKLISYGHQEFNNPFILNSVKSKIDNGQDVLNRNILFRKHRLADLYPENIVRIINEKFKFLVNE